MHTISPPTLHPVPPSRVVLWLIVAMVFAGGAVAYSYQDGPLVLGPTADAAGYFTDAIQQVRLLYDRGVAHWAATQLSTDASESARSPYARLLAMAAFLVFGFHDWAPYLGNGLVVFALLCIVDTLLGPVRPPIRLSVAMLVLTVPLVAHAVLEFIPDFACGIATAFAIVATQLLGPTAIRGRSWRRGALLGLLWVVPMLTKPNVIPVTTLLLIAAVTLAALSAATLERPRVEWREVLAWLGAGVVTILLLAGPYFAVRGVKIFNYVWENIFGERAGLWKYQGAWYEHAAYFILGPSGRHMLGSTLWLLLALLLVGLVAVVWRGSRDARLLHLRLGLMVFGAYLIPTVNQVKTPWFGLTFQVLIVLWAVVGVRSVLSCEWRDAGCQLPERGARAGRSGRWASMTMVMVALLAVLLVRPDGDAAAGSPRAAAEARLRDGVWTYLRTAALEHVTEGNEKRLRVAMLSNGPVVNRGSFRYAAAKEGLLDTFDFEYRHEWDLARFSREIARADVVIASEQGNGMVYSRKPASLIQDQTLAVARADAGLVEVARLPGLRGKGFYLFERRSSAADQRR